MGTSDYKTMTTAEIRAAFLDFFEGKGCRRYPSSSLVPDDPSLLLANAGMNQFKEYYQGTKHMAEIGATSCQKCLRTNDIDNIGDSRHLSFFEMLGNFSFGGYSKRDACAWALEFCCDERYLGLPMERLYFTVYVDDDETSGIWQELGVEASHITRLGADDNFWAAGPTGPCGPCSEIYFDQGEEYSCGSPDCAPGCDCERYLEFWNLVFTQYDRQEDGSLPELPHRNVDTGMGLERIAAIMAHEHTNYEGDVLRTLIGVGEELSGRRYHDDEATDKSLRILADHSRAVTFMIGDGILPGNEGRGYILRRLLRRAVYHGRLMGISGAFLTTYSHEVTRLLGDVYPAIVEGQALIDSIISAEEAHFSATLETGEALLKAELAKLDAGATLSGDVAFRLHDQDGFPIDLTREIAELAGHPTDIEGFEARMAEQRERARASANRDAWSAANDVWAALSARLAPTEFVGYDLDLASSRVVAIVCDGAEAERVEEGGECEVVLTMTPFYAEMGGQVGDTGTIETDGATLRVTSTERREGDLTAHLCTVELGTLGVGQAARAQIDRGRRELIRRNHTATHLLDAALKKVLGDHVNQAGSLVDSTHLRFDFTHFEAMTAEQVARVEGMVNAQIFAAKPVVTQVMGIDEARASGAVALFGEKYGDVVRVVSVGEEERPFSRELCGGTHVRNTAEIGLFKICSEGSVGSNARRLEAVTSMGAIEYVDERLAQIDAIAATLKCRPQEVADHVEQLRSAERDARKRLKEALAGGTAGAAGGLKATQLDGYACVFAKLESEVSGKELRSVWDGVRDNAGTDAVACVLVAPSAGGKVSLLAAGTTPAVKAGFDAGAVIGQAAEKVGGRGGGRPNMAQAGGRDASGMDAALEAARQMLGA